MTRKSTSNLLDCDVLVLGSGFGGSLLTALLGRIGSKVCLVDRRRHPRFSIGESSTPLADQALLELANQYDLPELVPLTSYCRWNSAGLPLVCGPKQGFSYFGHTPDSEFDPLQQLLVIARSALGDADTHWLRSDVDHYIFSLARRFSKAAYEQASYSLAQSDSGWICSGTADGQEFEVSSPFVVDATGAAGEVLTLLKITDASPALKTQSAATFAHFAGVRSVEEVLDEFEIDRSQHPFRCDDAAVHHVLADGWMWQLRFDDGIVSAGILSPPNAETGDPDFLWSERMRRFPFLARQFEKSRIVRPVGGLQQTGRLQRLKDRAAGKNWAALPSTVGFVDPLHSTGLAHTVFAVRRLIRILTAPSETGVFDLANYSDALVQELRHIDTLVEGCYAGLPSFRLWNAWCMLYFAAVTSSEADAVEDSAESFLRASDNSFRAIVRQARQRLDICLASGATDKACDQFENELRDMIAPWNTVGLLDSSCRGMYSTTACPVN